MDTLADPGAQRPAALLLHSSGSSAKQWRALQERLQAEYRVLPVEFHGHGSRPGWPHARPMTLADDAALAAAVLKSAGAAHVVGHSYGGAVALKLACMHPALVRSVVAYEPVLFRVVADYADPSDWRDTVRVANRIGECVAQGDNAAAGRAFVDFWSGAGAWDAAAEGARSAIAERMPSVARHFEALFAEPFRPREIAAVGRPMLVLCGGRTTAVTRRICEVLREALPSARHEVLPGMGHLGPITDAERVNKRIADFLFHEAHALH